MMRQDRFAKKELGQNFLTNTEVRHRIVDNAGDIRGKNVLEIGPGLGFLTTELLDQGANLTAIEFDPRAVEILTKQLGKRSNFNLMHGDILRHNLDELYQDQPYAVIANIPYHITSPILRKLMAETANQAEFALLMVQKEVGEKICQQKQLPRLTGHPDDEIKIAPVKKFKRSILSLSVEVFAETTYCFTVPRTDFEPAPKVDSAIIKLVTRKNPLIPKEDQADFFTVVNAGFAQKRKKIGNHIGSFFGIESNLLLGDIDPHARAETLEIEDWKVITQNFQKHVK